jgi:hypothetical protein
MKLIVALLVLAGTAAWQDMPTHPDFGAFKPQTYHIQSVGNGWIVIALDDDTTAAKIHTWTFITKPNYTYP